MLNQIDSKNIYNFLRLENYPHDFITQQLLEINNLIGNDTYFMKIEQSQSTKLLVITDSKNNILYSYKK